MSHATIGEQLAGFIHRTNFSDLPAPVVEQAKSRLLDCLSTAIAARALPVPAAARKFVAHNTGAGTLYGHRERVPAADAALVNATLINGCTHDDFLQKSHPGAVTVAGATAVAEEQKSSGRDLLAAIVLGYELVGRAYLGAPGMLPKFRGTGVAGAVGAAASAAKLLQLDRAQLVSALGLSTMFASGFGEGFRSGTMDVKLNVGWAARSGVSAAQLAQCGATASPLCFEGESGFFRAFSGTAEHAQEAVRNLGAPFLIDQVTYKERPICIFTQTPVHLALQLSREQKLDAAKIRRVLIIAPEATYTNPGYLNVAPYTSALAARISARFCVAAALLGRPVETYKYYDSITDAEVLAFADKIELRSGGETGRIAMEIDYAGTTLTAAGIEMDTLRPSLEKVVAKCRRLTGDFFGERQERFIDTVLNLEKVKSIRELTDQLQPAH